MSTQQQAEKFRCQLSLRDLSYSIDPGKMMLAAGMPPDVWQGEFLRSNALRTLMLCSRQSGKSTTVATKALAKARVVNDALVLIVCPAQRQSDELLDKVKQIGAALIADEGWIGGKQVGTGLFISDAIRHLRLYNGSRIVALPGKEQTIRGFSGVDLLIFDEAARIIEELYRSARPMLAVSGGELVGLSTPWGKRGWFYEAWESAQEWQRIKVTAYDCPRITPEFLAEELDALGPLFFASEYLCEFVDSVDMVFGSDITDKIGMPNTIEPLRKGRRVVEVDAPGGDATIWTPQMSKVD